LFHAQTTMKMEDQSAHVNSFRRTNSWCPHSPLNTIELGAMYQHGPIHGLLRQRFLRQKAAAPRNEFDDEFDSVRQQPAPRRDWRRHPVADDLDDEASVVPRRPTAQRRHLMAGQHNGVS